MFLLNPHTCTRKHYLHNSRYYIFIKRYLVKRAGSNLHNSRYYVFIKLPEALSQSIIYTVVDIMFLLNKKDERINN